MASIFSGILKGFPTGFLKDIYFKVQDSLKYSTYCIEYDFTVVGGSFFLFFSSHHAAPPNKIPNSIKSSILKNGSSDAIGTSDASGFSMTKIRRAKWLKLVNQLEILLRGCP